MNSLRYHLGKAGPLLVGGLALGLALWLALAVSACMQLGKPFPGFRPGYYGIVSLINNEPHWTGLRAGLRGGDVIRAVDGRLVAKGAELVEAARAVPLGTPLTYRYERAGATAELAVPTQRLGVIDWISSFGVRLLTGLLMIAIGAVCAFLRPDNRAARANLWLTVGMGLYFASENDFELSYHAHPFLYYATALWYASAAFAMALNFPLAPAWLARRPAWQWLPWGVGLAFFLPILGVFALQGGSAASDHLAQELIMLWPNLALLLGLVIFIAKLVRARDMRERNQLKVLLAGICLAFLPSAFMANIPLMTGFSPPAIVLSLTQVLYVLFPLSLAYAILRHNLFDITVIIKRTTQYAALTAFLVGGYMGVAALVRALLAPLGLHPGSDWENVVATAVIAVAFVPVRDRVARAVDRLFHRTGYDFKSLVATVTATAQSTLDLDEMTGTFMAAIGQALHPRFIYILTRQPAGDMFAASGGAATWGQPPIADLKTFEDDPLLTRSAHDSEVHYTPGSGLTGALSPLAALGPHYRVPLQVGEEVVGFVILGPKRSDEAYSDEDRELLAATRLPLASAIKTAALLADTLTKDRLSQELERARAVQEAMLPRALPELAGFDFAASSTPCYEASGDYFDFLPLPDGRLGVAVADVAGKGMAAAMATAMAKSALFNQAQSDPEVLSVLGALNRLLFEVSRHAAAKSFTTCLYALLDPAAMRLRYACAGHFPPVHYEAAAGRLTEFPLGGGFPLGVREKAKHVAYDVTLRPGDVLVFYTDGVTEAASIDDPGDQFESERLGAALLAHRDRSAAEIHDAILDAVNTFSAGAPQTDDVTLVVVKVLERADA